MEGGKGQILYLQIYDKLGNETFGRRPHERGEDTRVRFDDHLINSQG
jgi:hypothetical protein